MKFVYQDLVRFLSKKPSKKILSQKLFQLGHEHEIHGDIFDMEFTPNRGDCLSLKGLARDLNIFFGKSEDVDIFNGVIEPLEFNFRNLSPKDCPRISFLEIEIEENILEYKSYLENYFNKLGINKTNLFTDISNYISYELGQPTHCFDSKSLTTELTFENKVCDNIFLTLLDKEIHLKGHNCVFTCAGEIISLAGVMGGKSTACTPQTRKVLIECAYFNPESIIGKSIKYNLISDASFKFERGVDILSQDMVLRRFIKIVQDHAKIKSIKLNLNISENFQERSIAIDSDKINKILGTSIKKAEYFSYLSNLGFSITEIIKVPSYRHDIQTQNDLAEEIARVIGYNNIKSKPINIEKTITNNEFDKISIIKSFLIKNNFSEVINSSFTSIKNKDSIAIDNPLDSNRKYLRTCIKDSLIENLLYNERRQKDSIKLFEISDIYIKNSKKQENRLGIIISGRLGNNYNDFSKKLDYKYFNNLLNGDLSSEVFKISEVPRSILNSKKKERVFYVEVSINQIPENFFINGYTDKKLINFVNYIPVSDFPSSIRDFSFSILNYETLNIVISLLNNISDEIIKDSFIFDYYKDDKSKTIKLGYRIVFQSYFKTLSDEEINQKVQEIIKPILELHGASIPGM